jgi:hypothetical protein
MSETVNRMPAPTPLSAVVAVVTSQPGRAVLRCLAACALQALQIRERACDCTRPD